MLRVLFLFTTSLLLKSQDPELRPLLPTHQTPHDSKTFNCLSFPPFGPRPTNISPLRKSSLRTFLSDSEPSDIVRAQTTLPVAATQQCDIWVSSSSTPLAQDNQVKTLIITTVWQQYTSWPATPFRQLKFSQCYRPGLFF